MTVDNENLHKLFEHLSSLDWTEDKQSEMEEALCLLRDDKELRQQVCSLLRTRRITRYYLIVLIHGWIDENGRDQREQSIVVEHFNMPVGDDPDRLESLRAAADERFPLEKGHIREILYFTRLDSGKAFQCMKAAVECWLNEFNNNLSGELQRWRRKNEERSK